MTKANNNGYKPTNVTVRFNEEEYAALQHIIEFFQEKTVAEVTKTDVLKYLVTSIDEIITEDDERSKEFFKLLNIDKDFMLGKVN